MIDQNYIDQAQGHLKTLKLYRQSTVATLDARLIDIECQKQMAEIEGRSIELTDVRIDVAQKELDEYLSREEQSSL